MAATKHLFRRNHKCSLVKLKFATLSTTLRSDDRNIATNGGTLLLGPELLLESSFGGGRRVPSSEISIAIFGAIDRYDDGPRFDRRCRLPMEWLSAYEYGGRK